MRTSVSIKPISKIDYFILYIYPIIAYCGFGWVGFNMDRWKLAHFAFLPLLLVYGLWKLNLRKSFLVRNMFWMLFLIIFSMVVAFFKWGQNFILSYGATAGVLDICFYFFLVRAGFSRKDIELYLCVNVIIYVILWLYAISQFPAVVFGDPDADLDMDRGFLRLALANRACVFVVFFYEINKWLLTKKNIYALYAVICFVLIFFMLTRMCIIAAIIVAGIFLIRYVKNKLSFLIVVFTLSFVLIANVKEDSPLGIMLSESEHLVDSDGHKDRRVEEYGFFFFNDTNIGSVIFGHGVAHTRGPYAEYYTKVVGDQYHFYGTDVGWAFLYYQFGLIGLCVLLNIVYRVFRMKVDPTLLYAKYSIAFFVIFTIASYAIMTHIFYFCICIYLLTIADIERKYKVKQKL